MGDIIRLDFLSKILLQTFCYEKKLRCILE